LKTRNKSTHENRLFSWSYKKFIESDKEVETRCQNIFDNYRVMTDSERINVLCDTRSVHAKMFAGLVPKDQTFYLGGYRGTPRSPLEDRQVTVRVGNLKPLGYVKNHLSDELRDELMFLNPLLPFRRSAVMKSAARNVAHDLSILEIYIRGLLQADMSPEAAIKGVAKVFIDHLHIHPYMDGNGHIGRFLLKALMYEKRVDEIREWTIHTRPYGSLMGVCLENYAQSPNLIYLYLKRWFGEVDSKAHSLKITTTE
jgi:hypothetical protein